MIESQEDETTLLQVGVAHLEFFGLDTNTSGTAGSSSLLQITNNSCTEMTAQNLLKFMKCAFVPGANIKACDSHFVENCCPNIISEVEPALVELRNKGMINYVGESVFDLFMDLVGLIDPSEMSAE